VSTSGSAPSTTSYASSSANALELIEAAEKRTAEHATSGFLFNLILFIFLLLLNFIYLLILTDVLPNLSFNELMINNREETNYRK
jgi:hypothetical protein